MNDNKYYQLCENYAKMLGNTYDYENFGNTKDKVRDDLYEDRIEDELLKIAEVDRFITKLDEDGDEFEFEREYIKDFDEDEQDVIKDVIYDIVDLMDLPENDETDDDDDEVRDDLYEDIDNKKYNQEHSWLIVVNCGKDKSYRYFHDGDKQINIKKCQKIVEDIEKLNHIKVDEIEIIMNTYDYNIDIDTFLSVFYGDTMLTKILDKQVTYNVNQNCMRIYKNHDCIYENNNGNICNEYYTLADCN